MNPGPRQVDRADLAVGPSCASCGCQRLDFNGAALALGDACRACGSRSIRVPRKDGQVQGDLIEFPQHPTPEGGATA